MTMENELLNIKEKKKERKVADELGMQRSFRRRTWCAASHDELATKPSKTSFDSS